MARRDARDAHPLTDKATMNTTTAHRYLRTLLLLNAALWLSGCAVVAVTSAAVSVAGTAVSVGASAVGLVADAAVGTVKLGGKAVGAVLPGDSAP